MLFADEALRVQASSADGPRQAALLLHSMSPGDRGWVVAQLSDDQRAVVEELVEELCSLGIAPDTGFAESFSGGSIGAGASLHQVASASNASLGLSGESAHHARLVNIDVGVLARVVSAEPARVTALLLRIHDWPWQEKLLTGIDVVKRRQIEAILAEMGRDPFFSIPAKLAEALMAGFGGSVSEAVTDESPKRNSWVSRAKRALGGKIVGDM